MFNAFLSYCSSDLAHARSIYEYLTNSGASVFFDKVHIRPGMRFQQVIEDALRNSESIIVLVGPNGSGPWQNDETYVFQYIEHNVRQTKPIIPVFLPGAPLDVNDDRVPLFLHQYSRVKFSNSLTDDEALFSLMQGVPIGDASGEYERPILQAEEDALIKRSVGFYEQNGEHYFERWRNSIPMAPLGAFLKEVRRGRQSVSVLDAGCGPGHHARFMHSQGVEQITAIDLCDGFLQIAKKADNGKIDFRRSDMRYLQRAFKKRNVFDGIWACGSCLHLPQESLERQLNEFWAVLKPGGVLGLSLQIDTPSVIQEDGRFFERYASEDLFRRVESLGFQIVDRIDHLSSRSTDEGKKKIKKWCNLIAIAPSKAKIPGP